MTTEFFKAGVQYGDFKGTAAADDHDNYRINDYMISQGLKTKDEQIVGIKLWSGEVHGKLQNQPVIVTAYIMEGPGFEEISAAIDGVDPIPVKQVRFEVSLEQFFGFFKRFEIAITRYEELNGREFFINN
ncbi:hypothetical protein [Pseudomonas viridiflava]